MGMTGTRAILRWALPAVFLGALAPDARASQWTDPSWPLMLRESGLVVLVRVKEGGTNEALVEAIRVFKGAAPEKPFWVYGFNDAYWPADAQQLESMQSGEQYYLFLERPQPLPVDGGIDPADPAGLVAARWKVWTPSAGDLPLDDQGVHYSLFSTGYSRHRAPHAADAFEAFLRHALAFQAGGTRDLEYLEALMKTATSGNTPAEEQAHSLLALGLTGQDTWSPSMTALARSPSPAVRMAALRLACSIPTGTDVVVSSFVGDREGGIRSQAAQCAAERPADVVGPALLKALEKSSRPSKPGSLMAPSPGLEEDTGSEAIVWALGRLHYRPAEPALRKILANTTDEYLVSVVMDALHEMGAPVPVKELEHQLQHASIRVVGHIARMIGEKKQLEMREALERVLEKKLAANDDIWPAMAATDALAALGDPRSGAVFQRLLERSNAAPTLTHDVQTRTEWLLRALARLKYAPARATVEQTFLRWWGVDSRFVSRPELLRGKSDREHQAWERVAKVLGNLEERRHTVRCIPQEPLPQEDKQFGCELLVLLELQREPRRVAQLRKVLARAAGTPAARVYVTWVAPAANAPDVMLLNGDVHMDQRMDLFPQSLLFALTAYMAAVPVDTDPDLLELLASTLGPVDDLWRRDVLREAKRLRDILATRAHP